MFFVFRLITEAMPALSVTVSLHLAAVQDIFSSSNPIHSASDRSQVFTLSHIQSSLHRHQARIVEFSIGVCNEVRRTFHIRI